MTKKIAYIVFVTMMLCMSVESKAYDFKDGDCYYTITSLSEQTVALTNSGEIVSFDRFGDPQYVACYGGNFVVSQTAEYSGKTFKVTSIEDVAFQNCNLESLTVPSSILSALISGNVQKLIIEDSNTPLSELKVGSLKKVGSVKEVYMGRNIIVPDDGIAYCFSDSGIEKIVFGNSVTYVVGGMFQRCQKLVSVELSSSVKEILNAAFSGCANLKTISGPNVEHIKMDAFSNCVSLESFDFPNLKTIDGGMAFQNCTSLKKVVLPQGLARIESEAFMGCTSLESVTIPASIVCIGNEYALEHSSVFADCPSLKTITVNSLKPIAISETTFDAQTYINATLKVPAGAKNSYMEAENWKNFFTIEEDANIDDDIFSVVLNGCSSNYDGYVEIGDEKYTDDDAVVAVRKGDKITLKFIPAKTDDEEYELGSVKVNGVDFTKKVVDNELTIEITENTTIDISWEYKEDPIFLSIKQADNGNVKLGVSKWDEYNVVFEPAAGWKIHSVSFNGTDVTNELSSDNSYMTPEITENSEIIVVYASTADAIDATYSEWSSPKVTASSGSIVVSNAGKGEVVSVYTTSGVLVNTAVTHNDTTMIRVQKNEVYLVKIGNKTFKIGM